MRDLVIVTTYFRAEYLWLCLQALADADGGSEKEVWVVHDHHFNEGVHRAETNETAEVVKHFRERFARFEYSDMPATASHGNSRCTLESYKRAHHTDARFVYLVEDDILVEKDFFRWHEAIQFSVAPFVSVGWHCQRNKAYKANEDPTAYIESSIDYTSWGVCWRRENLTAVVAHASEEYYQNMAVYMACNFPQSPRGFVEQDGLVQNVLISGGGTLLVAWPCVKRAYHVGITGYHRTHGHRFAGNLASRVAQLREAIQTGSLVNMRGDYVTLNDIDKPRGFACPWDVKDLCCKQRLS